MTNSERQKALDKARAAVIKDKSGLLRNTDADLVRLLKAADQLVRDTLARAPTDYERWNLPQLSAEIRRALDTFSQAAGAKIATAAGEAWALGQKLIDSPLAAALPEARIVSLLPHLAIDQLAALRAFAVDRIKDIGVQAANKITTELGLVAVGAQPPSSAVTRVTQILGESSRSRARTIVTTNLGMAFSVASQARNVQAQ